MLLKAVIREGNLVPLSPAFGGPVSVLSCSRRCSLISGACRYEAPRKGERRGWPVSALCVCGERNDVEFGFPHSLLNL